MTVAEVVAEVEKDRLFYDDSGGGVTFSGGEPFAQPDFLRELLACCHSRGIHTAVDTCGFCPREELLSAASLADLFLYDLKIMDENRHRLYTGVSNAAILENLTALASVHENIWIRVPIIPGVNDDIENLQAVASLVSGVAAVRQLNLLPYHRTGTAKFRRLGRPYDLEGISDLSLEHLEEIGRIFSDLGITVKLGG
jgi:pyruvate formate lyase activating enzyme